MVRELQERPIAHPNERVIVIIDAADIFQSAHALGFTVDFRRLLRFFQTKTHLVHMYCYAPPPPEEGDDPLGEMLDWLDYNGLLVERVPDHQHKLSVSATTFACNKRMNQLVLFAGDGCYQHMIQAVQIHGPRITVVSALTVAEPTVADALRRLPARFLDLALLQDEIELKNR